MKVLFITRKYPPSTGGMELFAYDLSTALAAKTRVKLVKWGRKGRVLAVTIALPYLFIRSFLVLARGGIDIIHAQDSLQAPTAYILSRLFRKPYVVVIHGLDITYTNWLFSAIVPRAVGRANAVVCISQAAAAAAKTRGVAESKISVIPLSVPDNIYQKSSRLELIAELRLPQSSQIILTVGRLVKRKGVAWFINEVLPGLVVKHPNLIYVVAGEGADRPDIEAAIAEKHLEQHVRLLGRTHNQLLWAAYNGADVFVMPNLRVPGDMEGFGLVLLEAALCELPVVASALEGIEEALQDGKNGKLVPPADAGEFQQNVARFLDDKNYAKAFGEAARRYSLGTYANDKVAGRYLAVYKQLV